MPYVPCKHCGVSAFTAALYSGRDTCPNCGAILPVDSSRERRLRLVSDAARRLSPSPPGRGLQPGTGG